MVTGEKLKILSAFQWRSGMNGDEKETHIDDADEKIKLSEASRKL